MNKLIPSRNIQVLIFFITLIVVLAIRLFSLTVVQGEEWSLASSSLSIKNIYTLAPRGEIRDRYGRLLAANKPRFVVQLVVDEMNKEEINPTVERLIDVFEKNEDTYIDNFPIIINEGMFEYTYQRDIRNWLISQEMPVSFTAAQAFQEVCRRQNISEDLDPYEAQQELQTIYSIFPPISVKKMEFTKKIEQDTFLEKYNLDKNMGAREAFYAIAENFEIDKNLPQESIRKILIFRDSLKSQGYRQYIPVKIATDISQTTIVDIKERSDEFKGVEVLAEPVRYYPYGSAASHVLGYLGQISEDEKEEYVNERKYNVNAMIGKDGIEKSYETELKGTDGVKSIEVNARGKMERVISETEARKGKDIYLTLDIELQKVAEEALEKGLKQIQVGGSYPSEWGSYNYSKAYRNANAGGIAVLDVKNGEVLAMASYPDFDPNLFATGIKNEDWNALQTQNPRDPLSPVPLYNIATRTNVQPGSIFKMVTATAAVDRGLDPTRRLQDKGYILLGDKDFKCNIYKSYHATHGYVNLTEALEVSCNYYFYDAGSGVDWARGKAKITKEPISIDTIMQYAQMYGLGLSTGVEITESVSKVPSKETKMSNAKSGLRNRLEKKPERYFLNEVASDPKKLADAIDEILTWLEEDTEPTRGETRRRLISLGVSDENLESLTDTIKYGYFRSAKWTEADALNISIGQGENQYTPLQMANYIATIANGGTLNKVTLVKGIQDKLELKKQEGVEMPLKDMGTVEYLRKGMHLVTTGSRGTARGVFGSFNIDVAGKTGTAQKAGKINPPDEVEYIKKYLPRINSRLTFDQVEAEMARLMTEEPEEYSSRNYAIREAVIRLSKQMGRNVTYAQIDAYKSEYDSFAWFVCFAPYDDPQIAICILLVQGGAGNYASPIAREVIAKYMNIQADQDVFDTRNQLTK